MNHLYVVLVYVLDLHKRLLQRSIQSSTSGRLITRLLISLIWKKMLVFQQHSCPMHQALPAWAGVFRLVEKLIKCAKLILPARAWLPSYPSLRSRQVNTVVAFITPSPGCLKGWRIFKITAVALGPKPFQELVFKNFKNRKRSACVDRQQVRLIQLSEVDFSSN